MRILITGGTGLIGRALCPALLAANHQLTVLSRKRSSVAEKCGSAVAAISDLNEWNESMQFDAVINLAGEPIVDHAWSESRKKALWDSRVTLTQKLVEKIAAAQHKPTVLLSGSAIGFYGDRGDAALDETATGAHDFAAQLCQAWESAAERASQYRLRVCLLRTGLVLSHNGGMLGRMLLPFRLGLGTQLGDGKQWMSWIHIDDYVAGVLRLLRDNNASGAYNFTAPQPETNRSFTNKLAHALHRTARLTVPGAFLKLTLGARAILLLGGQKVLPRRLEELGFQFQFPQLEDALKFDLSD